MEPWSLLSAAASLARRARKLQDWVRGGILTDVLGLMGDQHFKAAIDELSLAQKSQDPKRRLEMASQHLIKAYGDFDEMARRGRPTLRRFTNVGGLRSAHEKAAGAAGLAAVLETDLGETVENRRDLLDRVAKHVSEDWLDTYGRKNNRLYSELIGAGVPIYESIPFTAYFELELFLLPAEWVRERPLGWRSQYELDEMFGRERYQSLNQSGYFDTPENRVLPFEGPVIPRKLPTSGWEADLSRLGRDKRGLL